MKRLASKSNYKFAKAEVSDKESLIDMMLERSDDDYEVALDSLAEEYLRNVEKNQDIVDAPDYTEGGKLPAKNLPLAGSPEYPHVMHSSTNSLYGYPLDQYSDDNESRTHYYGLYSLID
tara:strand:+ start:824 stop:1180 length:357 start_codon:yes stop_codon:yes gene_type:complete